MIFLTSEVGRPVNCSLMPSNSSMPHNNGMFPYVFETLLDFFLEAVIMEDVGFLNAICSYKRHTPRPKSHAARCGAVERATGPPASVERAITLQVTISLQGSISRSKSVSAYAVYGGLFWCSRTHMYDLLRCA